MTRALTPGGRLTELELRVLAGFASGKTISAIAGEIGCSVPAAQDTRHRLFGKLGAGNAPHAVLLACRAGLLPSIPAAADMISPRHLEALRLAAAGNTNAAIAEQLGIAPDTVKWRLHHAYRALGTDDRAHAVVIAIRLGLIDPAAIPLPEKVRVRLAARQAREAA